MAYENGARGVVDDFDFAAGVKPGCVLVVSRVSHYSVGVVRGPYVQDDVSTLKIETGVVIGIDGAGVKNFCRHCGSFLCDRKSRSKAEHKKCYGFHEAIVSRQSSC